MNDKDTKTEYAIQAEPTTYQTGSTKPPKSRLGLILLLLGLVIFLGGIASALGIMNIRLFQQLNGDENHSASVSFNEGTQGSIEPSQTQDTVTPTAPGNDVTVDIRPTPEGVENVPQQGGLSYQQIYDKASDSVVSITCRVAGGSSPAPAWCCRQTAISSPTAMWWRGLRPSPYC